MTDRADGWQRALRYCPRHGFFIKTPEIFQGATPTPNNQNIGNAMAGSPVNGANDVGRSGFPLDRRGVEGDRYGRAPPREHRENVVDSCAGGRGDHPYMPGRCRQRFLAGCIKQPFVLQFTFQFLESLLQCPQAGRLDVLHNNLEVAPVLIERDLATDTHLFAFFRDLLNTLIEAPEHGAADLALAILEGKIPVAGGRAG